MDTAEILFGILIYVLIFSIWHSRLFFGQIVNEEGEIKKVSGKAMVAQYSLSRIVPAFLLAFSFSRLIIYTAVSPYVIALLLWIGCFLPITIFLVSIGRIGVREAFIYVGGFFVSLIGVATVFVIW